MSCGDQRASRRFINAARLHADHAILNAVGAADTICSSNLVQIFQKLHGPDAVSVETDGNPLLEIDRNFAFALGTRTRIHRQHE